MLLDEATSALDSLTEAEILASVEAFRGHTLGLMIAHRVTTLRECDRIFVIEDGAIVESGTYSELLRASQRFRDLAAMGGGSVPGEPAAEGAERSACAKAEPC
jgi:ABC-type multidrug transport system fused ATPase/permease subunit